MPSIPCKQLPQEKTSPFSISAKEEYFELLTFLQGHIERDSIRVGEKSLLVDESPKPS